MEMKRLFWGKKRMSRSKDLPTLNPIMVNWKACWTRCKGLGLLLSYPVAPRVLFCAQNRIFQRKKKEIFSQNRDVTRHNSTAVRENIFDNFSRFHWSKYWYRILIFSWSAWSNFSYVVKLGFRFAFLSRKETASLYFLHILAWSVFSNGINGPL